MVLLELIGCCVPLSLVDSNAVSRGVATVGFVSEGSFLLLGSKHANDCVRSASFSASLHNGTDDDSPEFCVLNGVDMMSDVLKFTDEFFVLEVKGCLAHLAPFSSGTESPLKSLSIKGESQRTPFPLHGKSV